VTGKEIWGVSSVSHSLELAGTHPSRPDEASATILCDCDRNIERGLGPRAAAPLGALEEPAVPFVLARLQIRDGRIRGGTIAAASATERFGDAAPRVGKTEAAHTSWRVQAACAARLSRLQALLDSRQLHLEPVRESGLASSAETGTYFLSRKETYLWFA